MKAIIIAAGIGSRLGDLTKDLPKPLVDVNGKSILQRQIEIFNKFGIDEIFIVTGYKHDKIKFSNVSYIYNSEYQQTEQIGSLMKARNQISGDLIISFGDILFEEKILINRSKELISGGRFICINFGIDSQGRYLGNTGGHNMFDRF